MATEGIVPCLAGEIKGGSAEGVEQGTSPLPPTVIASFIASGSEATSEAIPPLPDQRGLPRPYGPRNDGWRVGKGMRRRNLKLFRESRPSRPLGFKGRVNPLTGMARCSIINLCALWGCPRAALAMPICAPCFGEESGG